MPCLAILLACSWAPPGAQAALTYDASLGASVLYTDNLHLTPERRAPGQPGPVRETIYAAVPEIGFTWTSGVDEANANFHGEYWTFTGDEDRDPLWLDELEADAALRSSRPFFLEAQAVRARAPRFLAEDTEAVVDQAERTALGVRSGLAWDVGPAATLELAYRGEIEFFTGGGEGEDDRVERHYGEALARKRWSPLWGGEVSADYGRTTRELGRNATELRLAAALDRKFSERLSATGRLEWVREEQGPFGEERNSPTRETLLKSAAVNGTLERGSWTLSYQESLDSQPDGDTLEVRRGELDVTLRARLGSEVTATVWYQKGESRRSPDEETAWGPTLSARWMLADWAAIDVGGGWSETAIHRDGAAEIDDQALRAGASCVMVLARHVVAEAGYAYRNLDSNDAGRSYHENVVYLELRYHFGILTPGSLPRPRVRG